MQPYFFFEAPFTFNNDTFIAYARLAIKDRQCTFLITVGNYISAEWSPQTGLSFTNTSERGYDRHDHNYCLKDITPEVIRDHIIPRVLTALCPANVLLFGTPPNLCQPVTEEEVEALPTRLRHHIKSLEVRVGTTTG